MHPLVGKINSVLEKMFPESVCLHEPSFEGREWEYVKKCLDTGWVSTAGSFVNTFEDKLKEFTGVGHAVAVINGTAALHICLELAGVKSEDEVLIPALTFVATANAVKYCGGIPNFVDSSEETLGVDPEKLESYLSEIAVIRSGVCFNKITQRPIKALVVVHTFGQPVDLDPIVEVCRHYKIKLIEDAAESLGSYYKGKHTGNWGLLSSLSFNGNKVITTGGGGAILTNDWKLSEQARHLTTTAKIPHKWAYMHDRVGYNYRLPNINAALGCAQLEQIPSLLKQKRSLAKFYQNVWKQIPEVSFFSEPGFAKSNYWLNVLLLNREYCEELEALLRVTNESGIMTRPAWNLLHKLSMFKNCPRSKLETAEDLSARLLNLPSSPILGLPYS
jgi:perosamine synthetase